MTRGRFGGGGGMCPFCPPPLGPALAETKRKADSEFAQSEKSYVAQDNSIIVPIPTLPRTLGQGISST